MDCTTDDRIDRWAEEPETDESKPTVSRLKKRHDRQRKKRKPSRPANYIGQRSNRRLKRL